MVVVVFSSVVQMLITNIHILNILSKLFLLYFYWKAFFFFFFFYFLVLNPCFRLDWISVTKIYSSATDKCNTLSDLLWKQSLRRAPSTGRLTDLQECDCGTGHIYMLLKLSLKNIILWSFFDSAQKTDFSYNKCSVL